MIEDLGLKDSESLIIAPRVQVPIYQILGPQSTHIESTGSLKYIIQETMDPLGKVL